MDERSKYEMRKRYVRMARRNAERAANEQRKKQRTQRQQQRRSAQPVVVATVVRVDRGRLRLMTVDGAAHEVPPLPGVPVVVGDEVELEPRGDGLRLAALRPRRTELVRPDPRGADRQRVLAANVDVGVIVVSVRQPPLRPGLIDRFAVALRRGGITPLLCVNKVDLLDAAERAAAAPVLAPYRDLGLDVLWVSAASGEGLAALRWALGSRVCVFVGHSGIGKSALLNALDPTLGQRTGAVRAADGKGRHTTTAATMFDLVGAGRVIDTPGLRELGLWADDAALVREVFAEFAPHAGSCRFADCTHVGEPDCAVRAAVLEGQLSRPRYDSYLRLLGSLQ